MKVKRAYRRGKTYTRVGKYRSPFEAQIAASLESAGINFQYENLKLKYFIPAKDCTYHPDFELPNGIIIEAKGEFDAHDRKKMLLVKEQHPDLDIRMVFYNANGKIYPGSKTTNAQWCERYGFPWSHRAIPAAWLKEPRRQPHRR